MENHMTANRTVGGNLKANPTTLHVLLCLLLVGWFASPGLGEIFDQDVTLQSGGNNVRGDAALNHIRSFGPGKIGVLTRTYPQTSGLVYVEWDRSSPTPSVATCVETPVSPMVPNVKAVHGLAYHNGQVRVGASVIDGTTSRFYEFTRLGTNNWTYADTGYSAPQIASFSTYDVNPVTGQGAFFIESYTAALGDPTKRERLMVYPNGSSGWTHSVVEQDMTISQGTDPVDHIRFSSDGTPWLLWNNSLGGKLRAGKGTPGATNFVDVANQTTWNFPTNVAIDDNGICHIVYMELESINKLRYRKWTGTGWSPTSAGDYTVDNTTSAQAGTGAILGFAVGPDGVSKAIMVRQNSSNNILVYTWSPGSTSWTKTILTRSVNTVGHRLVYDCLGNLYGFYVDSTYNLHILYSSNQAGANLFKQSSFEDPRTVNMPRDKVNKAFLDVLAVRDDGSSAGAHHGSQLLNFRNFVSNTNQAMIFQQPFRLNASTASLTAWVRARSTGSTTVYFSLYDSPTSTTPSKALGYYTHSGNDAWVPVQVPAVDIPSDKQTIDQYLGFTVVAPSTGCEVDLDQIGMFAGNNLPLAGVGNSGEFHFKEAEALANGTSWVTTSLYASAKNDASGPGTQTLRVLSGAGAYTSPPDVEWNLTVKTPDTYNLWCRFLHTINGSSTYAGEFTFEVFQDGMSVPVSRTIQVNDAAFGSDWYYVLANLQATLKPGPVVVRLKRPATGVNALTRNVDVLLLTNDLSYVPNIQELLTPTYMRYTNLGRPSNAPYCVYITNWVPNYGASVLGMLSRAGVSENTYVPGSDNLPAWLGTGQASPWIRLNPYQNKRDVNMFEMAATTSTHVVGLLDEPFEGLWEFALGTQKQVIADQQIPIDQAGYRMLFTTHGDTASYPELIKYSTEHIAEARAVVAPLHDSSLSPITFMEAEVCVGNNMSEFSDGTILADEIDLIKDIGANNIQYVYDPTLDKQAYGLLAGNGTSAVLLFAITNACFNQTDTATIRARVDALVAKWGSNASSVDKCWIGDEVYYNDMLHVLGCSTCTTKFQEYLTGLFGEDGHDFFGCSSWTQVVPVSVQSRGTYPKQYYYTHLFRLQSFANHLASCDAELSAPGKFVNARSYHTMNDNPLSNGKTWVAVDGGMLNAESYDPFITFRTATRATGWGEDWLGTGIGPIQTSLIHAYLRSATRPNGNPYGEYVVARNDLTRTKIYEAASSGANRMNIYNYGPGYISVNTWSLKHYLYPYIVEPLDELRRANAGLVGATRQPADVAILYNRTAGIWDSYYLYNSVWLDTQNAWELDASFTYYALRHAGYNVDILPEEDILLDAQGNPTIPSQYKVLYVNGMHIRQDTANAISAWINSGSGKALVGTARVGQKDEFDANTSTLNNVFGISAVERLNPIPSTDSRDFHPGATAANSAGYGNLATVTMIEPANISMWTCLSRERLTPSTATSIGEDASSNVLATKRDISTGSGTNYAIRYGFFPGATYFRSAWGSPFVTNDGVTTPVNFNTTELGVVAHGASLGAAKVATASIPTVEFTRFDKTVEGVNTTSLFIINHKYNAAAQTVTISIPNCPGVTSPDDVKSARPTANVQSYQYDQDGNLVVTLYMDRTSDILTITH
jgi:hypothetical protein